MRNQWILMSQPRGTAAVLVEHVGRHFGRQSKGEDAVLQDEPGFRHTEHALRATALPSQGQ